MILYQITSQKCGKAYIGITVRGLKRRWYEHVRNAVVVKEPGALFDAIRSDGPDAFRVEILARAEDWAALQTMERAAIAEKQTTVPLGYNSTAGGQGMLGWNPSPETRAKIVAANTGRKHTPETRAKMRAAHKGKIKSQEHRASLSKALTGRKFSEQHLRNMQKSHEGKGPPPEHMEKLRRLATGRACAPATRAKISAGLKARAV